MRVGTLGVCAAQLLNINWIDYKNITLVQDSFSNKMREFEALDILSIYENLTLPVFKIGVQNKYALYIANFNVRKRLGNIYWHFVYLELQVPKKNWGEPLKKVQYMVLYESKIFRSSYIDWPTMSALSYLMQVTVLLPRSLHTGLLQVQNVDSTFPFSDLGHNSYL